MLRYFRADYARNVTEKRQTEDMHSQKHAQKVIWASLNRFRVHMRTPKTIQKRLRVYAEFF